MLLLLSHFSRVRLCVTPQTAAHQAPPSLGFSRQEHWSGLPFPSPTHESEKWKWSRSVVFDSSQPHGLQPTRLLHPWDFPGKSTGVGRGACYFELWPQFEESGSGWEVWTYFIGGGSHLKCLGGVGGGVGAGVSAPSVTVGRLYLKERLGSSRLAGGGCNSPRGGESALQLRSRLPSSQIWAMKRVGLWEVGCWRKGGNGPGRDFQVFALGAWLSRGGGGRGSDRGLDSGLNSLYRGGDAHCVLGVGGSEPEMCNGRSQIWDVQQESTHRERMQVRGKSPTDPAFRGSLVSLSRPLL